MSQRTETPLEKAVRLAGGQHSVARICRVSQPTVWNWLQPKRAWRGSGRKPTPFGIPKDAAILLAEALENQVTPRELRPDLFE